MDEPIIAVGCQSGGDETIFNREHGVAVTATPFDCLAGAQDRLAALDPKQHPFAVYIADLEFHNLGRAKACTISDRQDRLMLESGHHVRQHNCRI